MMNTSPTTSLKLIARAAVFTFVAIGGMGTGLGLTTYTVAKANDMVVASVSSSATGASQQTTCYLK
jgi:hypothetical protein